MVLRCHRPARRLPFDFSAGYKQQQDRWVIAQISASAGTGLVYSLSRGVTDMAGSSIVLYYILNIDARIVEDRSFGMEIVVFSRRLFMTDVKYGWSFCMSLVQDGVSAQVDDKSLVNNDK